MVMTENDDKLIEQFLAPGRREIADDGFSRRVVQRLPDHRRERLAQVWTWTGFAVVLGLFIALDGVQQLWNALREVFVTTIEQGMAADIDPKSLLIAGVVLLFLGYKKIASLA